MQYIFVFFIMFLKLFGKLTIMHKNFDKIFFTYTHNFYLIED